MFLISVLKILWWSLTLVGGGTLRNTTSVEEGTLRNATLNTQGGIPTLVDNSTSSDIDVNPRAGVKYADDCTLPSEWRAKGLQITPSNYLSYLERRIKSGYSVSVTCVETGHTFISDVRNLTALNDDARTTIDYNGYIKVACDTNVFAPNIFAKFANGSEITNYCAAGCTEIPLDGVNLYDFVYPANSHNSVNYTIPIAYVASSKQYLKDKGKWITDPGTAISINCKTKFTRPVKDEGVNRIRCQKAGGFTPAASTAHKCKPGCPDWTIPRSIGLVMTAESKAASIKSGEPPFAYGDKITFKCISPFKLVDGERLDLDETTRTCDTTTRVWTASNLPYCTFTPGAGHPLLYSVYLLLAVLVTLLILVDYRQ